MGNLRKIILMEGGGEEKELFCFTIFRLLKKYLQYY